MAEQTADPVVVPYPEAFARYVALMYGPGWAERVGAAERALLERQWAFGTSRWTVPFTPALVERFLPNIRVAMGWTALYFQLEALQNQTPLPVKDEDLLARTLHKVRLGWEQSALA